MTREEEILSAARQYNNGITFSNPSNVLHFEAGAKWADEHPVNVFHDASEEPQVYETEDGNIITYSETDGYKLVEPNFHENECAWLHLVSDVLTWKEGIGQYLYDPEVQELAKRLCSEYSQKLYYPSNSSNIGKE